MDKENDLKPWCDGLSQSSPHHKSKGSSPAKVVMKPVSMVHLDLQQKYSEYANDFIQEKKTKICDESHYDNLVRQAAQEVTVPPITLPTQSKSQERRKRA